jgi:hypothetical protein
MSYRNPQIIRDTSAELYGQAAASIGQSLSRGIMTLAAKRDQQRKKADAEAQRTQQIGYGIQTKAYEKRNKVYSELLKKEPGLAEQFKKQTESLLMGDDEIGMGAIEARTILATGQNLSVQEKQDLQGIINRYEVFQNGLQGNAGKILAETELYNNTSPADFDNKYRWAGSNQYERTASQFAAAALSDEEIPGARYEKKLYTPTKDGEQVVGIKVFVDPNDPANKGKFDDETMYPRNQNGEVEIEWKKDLNKWDEGLLEEIVASPDGNALFKNAGITNDQNQWNEDQFLSAQGKSVTIKNVDGQNITTVSRDINVSGWANNDILQDEIKSKAAGYQGMRDDELSAFMQVKMKVGGFNVTEFRKLSTPEQQAEIEKELNEDFIIQKTKGLSKRAANIGEPGAVVDPLNPVKLDAKGKPMLDNNGKEIPNYVVYSQPVSSKVTSTSTDLSSEEIKAMNKSEQQAYFTKKLNEIVFPTNSDTGLIEIEGNRFSTMLTGLNASLVDRGTEGDSKYIKIKSNITGKQMEVSNSISSDELKKALSILSGISLEQSDKDFPITYDDGYDLNY